MIPLFHPMFSLYIGITVRNLIDYFTDHIYGHPFRMIDKRIPVSLIVAVNQIVPQSFSHRWADPSSSMLSRSKVCRDSANNPPMEHNRSVPNPDRRYPLHIVPPYKTTVAQYRPSPHPIPPTHPKYTYSWSLRYAASRPNRNPLCF